MKANDKGIPSPDRSDEEQLADVLEGLSDIVQEQISAEDMQNIADLAKEKEAKDNLEKYLRAIADLENLKKRAIREKAEVIKFGNERLIEDILPVYDALEIAIKQTDSKTELASVKEGLETLQSQLFNALKKHGVGLVESLNKEFDPNFHEALLQRESTDFPHNTVLSEFEKGFTLNGRLLRPARVEVCKNN